MGVLIVLIFIGYLVYKCMDTVSKAQKKIERINSRQSRSNTRSSNYSRSSSSTTVVRPVDNSFLLPNYTVVDVETTGLNYRNDRIVQFAALRVRNHQPVAALCFVVNPGIPIPPEASRVNGFTDDQVKDKEPFCVHISEVLNFLGNDVLIAHNSPFDSNFIEYQIGETLPNHWLDTLRFAREAVTSSNYKLTTLYRNLCHKEPIDAHDALGDCKMTHEVFEAIISWLGSKGIRASMEHPDNVSWYPIDLPKREFQPCLTPDVNAPFYKKNVVFTGKISGMTRKQAIQAVIDQGGDYSNEIRKKTDYLVCGTYAVQNTIEQAKARVAPDKPIQILSADEFKNMIERKEPCETVSENSQAAGEIEG